MPITNIDQREPNTLNLEKIVSQINNTQIQRPGSEYLIPNKSCNIKENEHFLVIDITEYIVRSIIAKKISSKDIGDNHYCTYIENQYIKDVNMSTFQIWLERFYTEIHPLIDNIFRNPETNGYTYIVITNLNPGIAGYYSDSNNYPIDIHYQSNDANIVFIDIIASRSVSPVPSFAFDPTSNTCCAIILYFYYPSYKFYFVVVSSTYFSTQLNIVTVSSCCNSCQCYCG